MAWSVVFVLRCTARVLKMMKLPILRFPELYSADDMRDIVQGHGVCSKHCDDVVRLCATVTVCVIMLCCDIMLCYCGPLPRDLGDRCTIGLCVRLGAGSYISLCHAALWISAD